MQLSSTCFADQGPIPEEFAFARPAQEGHVELSHNRNPDLSWSGLPAGCRSLCLICVDIDAPTVADDVNREGRTVAAELARGDFHHWVLIDLAPTLAGIGAGEVSAEVTTGGKQQPAGPQGSRQGVNDYTSWFANDADMRGTYRGYDGPAPPWNDERVHRYEFRLYALDLERCPVEGDFQAADVLAAIEGHVLAQACTMGTYTLNPNLTR